AVGGEPVGPVTALDVAVVQAGGVEAADAVLAAPATHVRLDDDAIAHLELVHGPADGDDVAGVFVAEDELTVGRHAGHAVVADLQIGAADSAGADADQGVFVPRHRDRPQIGRASCTGSG